MALRLVFFGTPEFALPSLRLLLSNPAFQVEAVVTQPDRPRGRGQHVSASPVKEFSLDSGLYVYQPEKIRDDSVATFMRRMQPDAVVIIAYGQKIPQNLIDLPRMGWINLHGSLLPKYRGAAPINWAIANGETHTGVSTMLVDATMDTGPILLQRAVEIGADETAPELSRRMAEAGAPLMVDTLLALDRKEITGRLQDNSLATTAPILKKEHGRVDWALPARAIYNRIRGFDPWPGAYTWFRGQQCHVWCRPLNAEESQRLSLRGATPGAIVEAGESILVACGRADSLRLDGVQLQGRKRVTAQEFANGARLKPEDTFTSQAPTSNSGD